MIAEFSKWVPDGITPKAIIVLTPPSQSDGRGEVNNPDWQKFAQETSTALVGCYFRDDDPSGFEGYCDASHDSGHYLLKYCTNAFNMKEHELKLLLFGFSAGGQFNYELAVWAPNYVKGFVVNKGGVYYTALAPPATRSIPSLWFMGTHDASFRKDIIRGIVGLNQQAGAKWMLIEENCSHEMGDSQDLSMEFFREILKKM